MRELLAAAVPMLLVPVPMRELLAQMFHDAMPAPDASWGEVLGRFPGAFADLLQADGGFVRDPRVASTAGYLLVGMGLLIALWAAGRRDETTTLSWSRARSRASSTFWPFRSSAPSGWS